MKNLLKLMCIVLALTLAVTLGAAGCGKKDVDSSSPSSSEETVSISDDAKIIGFNALSAGEAQYNTSIVGAIKGRTNDVLLYENPDRGFRTTMPIVVLEKHPDPENPGKYTNHCDLIKMDANGRVSYNSKSKCNGKHDVRHMYGNLDKETNLKPLLYMFQLVYLKTGKTDYNARLMLMQGSFIGCNKSEKLPQYIFDILDMYFDLCREYKIRVIFRYGYHGVQLNWQLSDENKAEHAKWGADEKTMIAHIKQLGPYIGKNLDVVHKLSSGFIGSGGEQAYNYQYPTVNYNNVIKAAVENICVPNGLYYTVRVPLYKLDILKSEPNYKYAKLIGFNNDAFYGETERLGWNSTCWQYNHNFTNVGLCAHRDSHIPNDWWNYCNETAAYTPQSGEMFHNLQNSDVFITGKEAILQLAHHRYTTLSQWNSYIEAGYTYENGQQVAADTVMQRWVNDEYITQEWLKENKIVYDPAWFYDDEGFEVSRNPLEFVRDHLGYRVRAEKLAVSENKVQLTLKNFGFAAAFTLESGFAVLNDKYEVVSTVKAGNPDTWYSHDPENWQSDTVLEHNVSAELKLPEESGKYYIAFYLKNGMNEYARLANDPNSVPFENGYNILHTIEIN